MAPEVALGEPYNLSADIYSFSILFWELCALEKAFGKLSQEAHREQVIKNNERPPLRREWKPAIQYILQSCWKRNPRERINAKDLYRDLKEQVDLYYHDGFEVCEDGRERKLCV
jgi:hypothetical protein